ncbi:MAG: hypothetical protein ACK4UJ_06855 [Leptonema sp. (in: bacteria)]
MNEPLTKSQAYKVFGELYKKERPPELQKKVEEIVNTYSDIFVRIQKIRELEKSYSEKKSIAKDQNSVAIKNKKTKSNENHLSSNLKKMIKGPDITQWGEETGTLSFGLFGFNIRFSNQVPKIFNLFEEKQILDTLRGMGFFINKGWEDFPPQEYNIVVTTYQFFKEYINVYPLFKQKIELDSLIQKTLKMQVLYANLLLFPNYKKMLEEEFIDWLKNQKDLVQFVSNCLTVMRIISRLEERKPKMTNVILSFYVLSKKKIISWEDLLNILNVKKPVTDKYRAPESIMKLIHQKIDKLNMEIEKRENTIKDILYIKKKYFLIGEDNKVKLEFLNQIVIYILKRQYGENRVTKEMVSTYISEPHRLLSVLLLDFDLNFVTFFSGTVTVVDTNNKNQEVSIFKTNLLKKELELYSELFQELNEFLKQYKNAQFSFQNYYLALKTKAKDIIIQNFIKTINKFFSVFRKFIQYVRIVLYNHEEAENLEKKGNLKENLQRTKLLPIEDFNYQPRFLPYSEYRIHSSGRIHNLTVKNALEELLKDLYNYLYLYREPVLLENLSSLPRLESEIQLYKSKLKQMGIEK